MLYLVLHFYVSKGVGLEINAEKTKYLLLSLHYNAGQNRETETANRASENVAQFIYLGTTVYQNLIQEIKRRLNLGNDCYPSVQNLLPSPLLSKTVKKTKEQTRL
jgi:hypothetical protein